VRAARVCGGSSSENRVNATPAMVSTPVWPGRKRARRGTCLGARVGETRPERDARWWCAARRRWLAIACAGKRGGRGKEAGEFPHPKAKLRRWLAAIEERRGGSGDGDDDRGSAAKAALARAAR
jgi:hypothetical protein